ncbi:hypothetical protein DPMN_104672 [Dreissena polymorpha]|uniref:Uncharacterized protein n=1 Tax=Dreissena polymorpha TaxID=45954 RepID=A0A9D4HC04_DREPO|nr:hypothetical protein DPMN_104672 [Dreissena polymorpha]
MAYLDTTSRQPEPENGFPSTSVLGHFQFLYSATHSKSWFVSLPKVRCIRPLHCHLRCSRPFSGDVVKPLSTYGQLPFRMAILPSSVSKAAGDDVRVQG